MDPFELLWWQLNLGRHEVYTKSLRNNYMYSESLSSTLIFSLVITTGLNGWEKIFTIRKHSQVQLQTSWPQSTTPTILGWWWNCKTCHFRRHFNFSNFRAVDGFIQTLPWDLNFHTGKHTVDNQYFSTYWIYSITEILAIWLAATLTRRSAFAPAAAGVSGSRPPACRFLSSMNSSNWISSRTQDNMKERYTRINAQHGMTVLKLLCTSIQTFKFFGSRKHI